FIPTQYTFEFPNPRPTWQKGPAARIPQMVQLGGTLAAVSLGIARHAIDALKEIAVSKVPLGTMASLRDRPVAQLQLGEAEGTLRAARAYLYACTDEIWNRGEMGAPFDPPALASTGVGDRRQVRGACGRPRLRRGGNHCDAYRAADRAMLAGRARSHAAHH